MRLFIGIPLSAAVVRELAALTAGLKSADDGLRWSAEAGWHITLQFLGQAQPDQYTCVTAGLRRLQYSPFEVQLEPPGFFDRAGVFFAGVRPSSELAALQQQVLVATQPCGFEPEDRPYHPHITLAREKGGRHALRQLKGRLKHEMHFSAFTANEFLLYESFPGPGGSRYEVRQRFALRSL